MKNNNLPSARANDMMVGTYFYKEGKIIQVNARNIYDCWRDNKEFNPIPITEELLEQLGAVRNKISIIPKSDPKYWSINDVSVITSTPDKWYVGFKAISGTINFSPSEIKYLHQFQILCLEMNGEMPVLKNEMKEVNESAK